MGFEPATLSLEDIQPWALCAKKWAGQHCTGSCVVRVKLCRVLGQAGPGSAWNVANVAIAPRALDLPSPGRERGHEVRDGR